MSIDLGNVDANSTLYIPFHTFDSNGASITLTGLAVTDIEIYKNGSITQRASDAGYALLDTDGIDFDGITGIHGFSIDLADNTDAGFYSAGAFYWVVISAVTVDTRTVNFVAATFRIGPAAANVTQWLGTAAETPTTAGRPNVNAKSWNDLATVALPLVPATAGRTLVVDAAGLADANVVKVGPTGAGTAQTAGDLQAALTIIDDFVDTEIAAILAAVDTEVAAIKAKTDSLTFTVAALCDANVLRLNGVALSLQNLEKSASIIFQGSVTGAATTTTLIDSALTQADTDFWKGRIVIFTSGSLKYQATDITAFDPALDKLTFTALTAAPSGGDTYVIL